MVYPISSLYLSIDLYTQKSGGQLVHLIKELAGELFTIKTGRPEHPKKLRGTCMKCVHLQTPFLNGRVLHV